MGILKENSQLNMPISGMKITEQTPTVLKFQPNTVGLGCCGTVFTLCTLLPMGIPPFLVGFTAVTESRLENVKCDRIEPTQINCELTSSSLLSKSVSKIDQLQGAKEQESTDSEGMKEYQVILIFRSKRITIATHSNSLDAIKTVDEFNSFIRNQEELSFKFKQDFSWFGVLFICGFLLLFCSEPLRLLCDIFLCKYPASCLFDKTSGQLYLKYQNMLRQSDVIDERLDAIEHVEVYETTDDNDGSKIYGVKLMLKSGSSIDLGASISNFENAKIISQFLGIPEQVTVK